MRSEFSNLVGAPNESLRLNIINYLFKYTFGIKTTLLESFRNQKRLDFGKTTYNNFVLARSEFLSHNGGPNECLRFIIIYYMFNNTFGIKTTLLESLWNQKSPLKARFRHNLSKGLSFCA